MITPNSKLHEKLADMQLGDHLGFAGLVMGALGVGLALRYPEKRWIGGVFLLVTLGLVIAWIYTEKISKKDDSASQQKDLIVGLVQYVEKNRVDDISDDLGLNLRVQMQRQKYLSANPPLPFNYSQFGFETIYRAREGNWRGDVITPGSTLAGLGVRERPNEVSFLVRSKKMSEDYAQLKAFSDNPLLPPAIKWDLDQYIHAWGKTEEAIADVLNEEAQKGRTLSPLDQGVLQQEVFRRLGPRDVLIRKIASDSQEYLATLK
jgi:hypothetical protein